MLRIANKTILVLLLVPLLSNAAIKFPKLSGRIVDNAALLSVSTKQQLSRQLAAHEKASSNQVVVVTLPNLQGYTIEEYGYQLGRHWGIGQKNKNNGVLLIVAEKERKVRIEVGYGLEGVITDAIAANIIHAVILPRFKQGNFNAGISEGANAIVTALGGKYQFKKSKQQKQGSIPMWVILLIIGFVIIRPLTGGRRRGRRYGTYWGGGGFGGRSGGGFSGGGGSFGGGGASGGW